MDHKTPPRIEYLHVHNYRALRDFELKNITPLTVFLGPNGSGKSTIFDVFAFLSDCFISGLRKAWDDRGRFRELRTRGQKGPITIEIKYREKPQDPIITYHLSIDENDSGPIVTEEWLQWRRGSRSKPFRFLDFKHGSGVVIGGDMPGVESSSEDRVQETMSSPDVLAVSTLGQFARNPRVSALRRFITDWYLSDLSADSVRTAREAGAQERLSVTGDNLPNVIQYLKKQHPELWQRIIETLTSRVPRLQRVETKLVNGRLLLQIKDAPFDQPILAQYASDGTLKMLAYLTILYDPNPPQLIGIEEPENYLHPGLLHELAEESRLATKRTQLMVTTHSPFFINGLHPEEVWVLYRDKFGFTQAQCAADIPGIPYFIQEGALLGHLWMEGHFGVGDPLKAGGEPTRPTLIR
jgi:predicted ATPase